jgi:hypothetical protein
VEQFLALYALVGFFGFVGTTGVPAAFVPDYRLVVYREVGTIPRGAIAMPGTGFSYLVF